MEENLFIFSNLNRKIVLYAFQVLSEIPTEIDFDCQTDKTSRTTRADTELVWLRNDVDTFCSNKFVHQKPSKIV